MGSAAPTVAGSRGDVALRAAIVAAGLISLSLIATEGDPQLSNARFAIPFAIGVAALVLAVRRAPPWLLRGVPDLSPGGLGLFRVALGIGLLLTADYVRDRLPRDPLVIGQGRSDPAFLRFGLAQELAQHPDLLQALSTMTIVAIVAFLLGALPRLSFALIVAGFTLQLLGRVQVDGNHDLDLPLMAIWTMLFVPWHAAPGLSTVVRRLRGRSDPVRASARLGFAVWLPGLTLGIGLAAGAYAKLVHSGLAWVGDGAVRFHFVQDAASAPVDWGLWVAGQQQLAVLLSAAAIAIEGVFIVHAFLRGWRVRLAFGLLGASLFLSFFVFMGIRWLPWWMLLLAFLPWEQLAGALRALPQRTVLIDGGCPMCRGTARVLHSLDLADRVTFSDARDEAERERMAPGITRKEALREMVVVTPSNGRQDVGFAGYRALSTSIPPLWPLAVASRVPGVPRVGDAVYRKVAKRRSRDGCDDERCAVDDTRQEGGLPAPAPLARSRAWVTAPLAATVALLFAQQIAVSVKGIEREPLLSNYPMYSGTFASTHEFDEATASSFSTYTFATGEAGDDVTSAVQSVPRADSSLVDAVRNAAHEGTVPTAECERAHGAASGVARRLGRPLARVAVLVDQRAFDWGEGRFYSKLSHKTLGVLDLARCEVQRPGAVDGAPAA
ncbi:MAG: DCC1-like thiol-disulfide oxidoreductase family protein [Solirubrobacteraceae bacterium]